MDLGPSGDARTRIKHVKLLLGVLIVSPRVIREWGPRPDQRHVTLDNVEELGKFISRGSAKYLPNARNAEVVFLGVDAGTGVLGILDHRTELVDPEHFPFVSDPVLLEQNGRSGFYIDSQSNDQHKGGQYQERRKRNENIQTTLDKCAIK